MNRHCVMTRALLHGLVKGAATVRQLGVAVLLGSALGCHDLSSLAGSQGLPSGVSDPASVRTEQGALQMYAAARYAFEAQQTGGTAGGAFVAAMLSTGLLTDELQSDELGGPPQAYVGQGQTFALDARTLPESQNVEGGDDPSVQITETYGLLQAVRGQSQQALGALAAYAPKVNSAVRGHLFALQGYSEILLADLYCSGVPLSTLDFNGDYTYRPGSTTAELYRDALTKFDSTLALSTDSIAFMNLARIGRGRALLDLDSAAAAAHAVADVPDNFAYQFTVNWAASTTQGQTAFQQREASVSDSEGVHGLPYRTAPDVRVGADSVGVGLHGNPLYFPRKYGSPTSVTPIRVADGVEARLIEAEAALRASDPTRWLERLNHLRQNATAFGLPDTLSRLQDPGTDTARVTVLFRERAFWLFLTAHRQGDLRRLVRQYHRQPSAVYPSGFYPSGVPLRYGADVTAPIPGRELANRLFHGCLSRGA